MKKITINKKAAALSYTQQDNAPRVVGAGQGLVAERIIRAANKNSVPIICDEQLAEKLVLIETGDEIPEELYQAVAEILAFINRMDKKFGEETCLYRR